MNPDLEKLVRLQAAEDHVKQLDATIAELPRQQAEADQELAREGEALEKAQQQLTECQQQRRQDETALQDLETRRSKYKGQLMEVKTNKE
jgi:predicted  nucleic acid-binding Zn-ribbon protein